MMEFFLILFVIIGLVFLFSVAREERLQNIYERQHQRIVNAPYQESEELSEIRSFLTEKGLIRYPASMPLLPSDAASLLKMWLIEELGGEPDEPVRDLFLFWTQIAYLFDKEEADEIHQVFDWLDLLTLMEGENQNG
jgi:hypothetical protein